MRKIKLNTQAIHQGLLVFCVSLMLSACGLAGREGGLAAGAKAQAEGKYRAAYIEAKKVLQQDNKNGAAWLLLGRASLMLGDVKDALNDLQNAKANGVPETQWAVPMGQALLVTQQYDQLLKTLLPEPLTDTGVKTDVLRLRGDAYRGLKQFDQAEQSYKAALALAPKDSETLLGLAKLATIAGDPAAADNYVQQALAASPESPQVWVLKGDLAFDAHQLAAAEADYQKALAFKKADWLPQEHFYALTRLANAQAQQDKLDAALGNIQTLEKMSPGQPYPHYLHAVVLYKQGHLDDAISQLQQVLKGAPNNDQAQMLMGAVNYAQGNYGQAEMYLSNIIGLKPDNLEARRLLALTFYREGRSSQAVSMLRPAVQGTPSDADLLTMLKSAAAEGIASSSAKVPAVAANAPADEAFAHVDQAIASGDGAAALRLLQAIPAGDPAIEARRNSLQVMAYVRSKRTDEAVKAAANYVSAHPQDSAAHLVYGTALVAANEHAKARVQYDEAYKLDPKNIAALLSLGSLDSLERNYKDAAGRYDSVLKQDPANETAMTAQARLAMLQGDKAAAIKWFNQAIGAAPKSPAAYIGLVMLYSGTGQFDEAVSVAKRLVDVEPDNPAAQNALGAAELNAGHSSEALKPLQLAVKLAPQAPMYRINLARAQLLGKNTKEAEDNLEQVIKADPGQVQAVNLLAFVKLQNKDMPGALSLARALQGQPATKAAGFMLEGDLYTANQSHHEAVNAYQQGLKIAYERPLVLKVFQAMSADGSSEPQTVLRDWLAKHPDDAGTRALLAEYYLTHKQNALAVTEYERVVKDHPSDVGALNNLAWAYTAQGNPKALELAERAYKLAPTSPSVQDTYAWALVAGNQVGKALPLLVQAAKAAPKEPSIHYHLAVAQARTGDKAGARTTLEVLQKSGADFEGKAAAEKLYRELGGAGGSAK
ncbi:PEP-CTERM system TPR-repeat protein PrsT [Rhodanobacter sp. AS-Z3]|uniref:XrtA/PEP-CTERM system TPR-repeat protein PrsT n=1 Tax=Rhodanobacter sp. AS-Z3 TaxID=3031330 RepID=UPI0024799A47|nr:XrtA/PEP-CTERM system TPR-repeat protein PrsT [Rhodanobacter sp. AS-Z3]WEN15359.1 PEP-CTERM system TPR-repeat protein PrsT [Rhodanobacter sp. AS-Z3]